MDTTIKQNSEYPMKHLKSTF